MFCKGVFVGVITRVETCIQSAFCLDICLFHIQTNFIVCFVSSIAELLWHNEERTSLTQSNLKGCYIKTV
jgi:hypothetical protein